MHIVREFCSSTCSWTISSPVDGLVVDLKLGLFQHSADVRFQFLCPRSIKDAVDIVQIGGIVSKLHTGLGFIGGGVLIDTLGNHIPLLGLFGGHRRH